MSYLIEKNVPIENKTSKYPFSQMEVGDSFFIVTDKADTNGERGKCSSGVTAYCKNNPNIKLTIRAVNGGLRCWRIK